MPTMEEFLKFLTERCHTLRVLNQDKVKQNSKEKSISKIKKERKVSLTTTALRCKICNGSHAVYKCEELLARKAVHLGKNEISMRKEALSQLSECKTYSERM